jgi:hypothetical protein
MGTCRLSCLSGLQVQTVCAIITGKEEFKKGYNAVGLSQGWPPHIPIPDSESRSEVPDSFVLKPEGGKGSRESMQLSLPQQMKIL